MRENVINTRACPQSDEKNHAAHMPKVRIVCWNVGSMTGRSLELSEVLLRRRISICCIQETKWKESKARNIAYAPQTGLPQAEKQTFWDDLHNLTQSIPKTESKYIGADFNGHVGQITNDSFREIHGNKGYGDKNSQGDDILYFAYTFNMAIVNTFFTKPNEHLITYSYIYYIYYWRQMHTGGLHPSGQETSTNNKNG
ncbi:unnamed protein product, partial [Brenthis ino]